MTTTTTPADAGAKTRAMRDGRQADSLRQAVRAVDHTGRQSRFDPNLICLYRDHGCLRALSTALPRRSSTT